MKKISKIFGLLSAALLLGSIVGCKVTVESPKYDVKDPIVTDKGVVFDVGFMAKNIKQLVVTRQEGKDGIEKKINPDIDSSESYCIERISEWFIPKTGVDYIYRFYNVNGDENYIGNGGAGAGIPIGEYSCVEKKVKFDKVAEKGTQLDALTADDIDIFVYEGQLSYKTPKTEMATLEWVVDGIKGGIWDYPTAGEHTVSVCRTWPNNYYAKSEPYEVKVTVEKGSAKATDLTAVQRNGDVVLKWYCKDSDTFTVERQGDDTDWNWEALDVEVTTGTDYKGKTYYTATDSTAVIGEQYQYRVVTDNNATYSGWVTMDAYAENVKFSVNKDEVTLIWSMSNKQETLADIAIYRAEKVPYFANDYDKDMDLYIKLDITPVYDERYNYYKAVDTKVPAGRYKYLLIIGNSKLETDVTVDSEQVSIDYQNRSTINSDNKDKEIILQWTGDATRYTYKLSYRTIDADGVESSADKELKATITNDANDCYIATFKPADFGVASAKVDFEKVKIYVNAYEGDTLVNPSSTKTATLSIDKPLTTIAYLEGVTVDSEGNVVVYGYNLEKARVFAKDTASGDDGNKGIVNCKVTLTKDATTGNTYKGKISGLKAGSYKIIVNIPAEVACGQVYIPDGTTHTETVTTTTTVLVADNTGKQPDEDGYTPTYDEVEISTDIEVDNYHWVKQDEVTAYGNYIVS